MRGSAPGGGDLRLDLEADPLARPPEFQLAAQVERVDLSALDDLVRAYAGVDIERGWLAVYAEARAEDGAFRGSVKPLVEGLDVLRPKEATEQHPLTTAREVIAGAVAEVLESQPEDRRRRKSRAASTPPTSGSSPLSRACCATSSSRRSAPASPT